MMISIPLSPHILKIQLFKLFAINIKMFKEQHTDQISHISFSAKSKMQQNTSSVDMKCCLQLQRYRAIYRSQQQAQSHLPDSFVSNSAKPLTIIPKQQDQNLKIQEYFEEDVLQDFTIFYKIQQMMNHSKRKVWQKSNVLFEDMRRKLQYFNQSRSQGLNDAGQYDKRWSIMHLLLSYSLKMNLVGYKSVQACQIRQQIINIERLKVNSNQMMHEVYGKIFYIENSKSLAQFLSIENYIDPKDPACQTTE